MANRLSREKSPYLLQHANNPVDWYPWGEEAFRKAREENKPIFLSIGYSTCHWCHVMERESFENEAVATALNANFVPIKVDREERPDIDRIYMTFVQATTGSGGWPMSVFLAPDLKPFFGGTYFPPDNRYGQPGFIYVLEKLAQAWHNDRDQLVDSGADAIEQLSRQAQGAPGKSTPDDSVFEPAFYAFRRIYDPKLGGFGGAPKFPRPAVHNFLLRYYDRTSNREALEMVDLTLKAMARGGMHDHLGGGFHRYSVDERWFLPHFEKMLYDQAQLAISYLEAYQITGERFHAQIARQILEYVLRDLTHPDGGFYSAEDADSPDPDKPETKREGAFYVWTQEEIDQLLGRPASEWFCFRYGVSPGGNVRNDAHHEFAGQNILYQAHTLDETGAQFNLQPEEIGSSLAALRAKLLEHRSRRPRPHLDDKVLTAWNGLMISAFAKAAQVLEDERYLNAARRAADFILSRCWRGDEGLLLRRFRDGEAGIAGFLDDYAMFAQALLDLYEAGFEVRDLETARVLTDRMIERFEDTSAGGFFSTAAESSDLVMRMKDDYDGAEPSGNSVAIGNLLRLAQYLDNEPYAGKAERALRAFSTRLTVVPAAVPQMLAALTYARGRKKQIVLVGDRTADDTRALLRALNSSYLPNRIVMLVDSEPTRQALAAHLPWIEGMGRTGAAATAYVCENHTCQLPTSDVEQFKGQLTGHGPTGAAGGLS